MQKNPLIDLYVTVLNEGTDSSEVKGSTLKKGSDVFGKFSEANKADENVKKDLEKPKKDTKLSAEDGNMKTGAPKKMKMSAEAANPFDALYQQFIAEDFGHEEKPEDNGSFESGHEGDHGSEEELPITDENIDEEEHETGEAEGGIKGAVAALEKALECLRSLSGEEEKPEEEEHGLDSNDTEGDFEDLGDEDEMGDLNFHGFAKESVEISKAPDKKEVYQGPTKSQDAKGVKKNAGKATVPNTGKGYDGKIEKMADKSKEFQGATKSQDTKGVKTGKDLFEQ